MINNHIIVYFRGNILLDQHKYSLDLKIGNYSILVSILHGDIEKQNTDNIFNLITGGGTFHTPKDCFNFQIVSAAGEKFLNVKNEVSLNQKI